MLTERLAAGEAFPRVLPGPSDLCEGPSLLLGAPGSGHLLGSPALGRGLCPRPCDFRRRQVCHRSSPPPSALRGHPLLRRASQPSPDWTLDPGPKGQQVLHCVASVLMSISQKRVFHTQGTWVAALWTYSSAAPQGWPAPGGAGRPTNSAANAPPPRLQGTVSRQHCHRVDTRQEAGSAPMS